VPIVSSALALYENNRGYLDPVYVAISRCRRKKSRGIFYGERTRLHRLRMFQQRRFGTITLKHWIARNKMHHSERSYGDHTTATTPGDRRPDEVTA